MVVGDAVGPRDGDREGLVVGVAVGGAVVGNAVVGAALGAGVVHGTSGNSTSYSVGELQIPVVFTNLQRGLEVPWHVHTLALL